MITNKKTMFIGWFIGLGSGLFISGIILSIFFYKTNNTIDDLEDINNRLLPVEDNMDSKDEEVSSLVNKDKNMDKNKDKKKDKKKELEKKTLIIDIDPSATARDITQLLVDNDIVLDYNEFIKYIVSMDAERKLIHGKKEFPLNASKERILEILMEY